MQEVALFLEQSALAAALRDSVWLYPLVNAGHVLGVALVVGSVVPLDLRILGLWPQLPLQPFWRALRTVAAAGLALAMLAGFLLFLTRASDYLASLWFLSKLAVLLLTLANVAFVMIRYPLPDMADGPLPSGLKVCAGISLVGWCVVLVLGRLVGYF